MLKKYGKQLFISAFIVFFSSSAWSTDEAPMNPPPESAGGAKVIYVMTDEQKLYAWEGNKLIYEFDVVTGRPGKETEAGVFTIFRKHEEYTSKTYGSDMPFTMFFTEDGKAIHGTQMAAVRSFLHAYLTEHVGSQGCVGLARDDAEKMFAWTPKNTRVVVVEEEPEE
jgi:lipoprotein-anchoring transpeptidase ErfK/SrfK